MDNLNIGNDIPEQAAAPEVEAAPEVNAMPEQATPEVEAAPEMDAMPEEKTPAEYTENENAPEYTANEDAAPAEPKLTFWQFLKGDFIENKGNRSPLLRKKHHEEGFFKRNRFVFLAFGIPLLLMIYSFFCAKLYPFGENQIMVIDMWHQYFEFFKILHEKLQTFGSMLYTWDGGLGTNFIALISYYAASPLYLLSIFVPTKFLTEAMAMIVVLKISFSGAFMCIYLKKMFGRDDFGTATFSILYALSAFAMGYYWCLMWLDVMALLPLCMLGMNRLIDEGKFKLYVISLALMLYSNYYIGIMMCIFIVIYYPVVYFSRLKARGTKYFLLTTARMAVFSVIAACIASVILIPTYFSMQNTYYIAGTFPSTDNFYNPILDVVSNLLPNVALTVRGGLPNIYCGLITFMMAILFLLCKKIPVRQKVLNCSILAFLLLSFNWNKLDYIWHCLHFPNELPYRYSFAFSFILVTMAYQAYLHLDDITPGQIGAVVGGGFIYMILAEKLYTEKFDYTVIYVSLGLLAAYAIVLAIHKTGRYKEFLTGVLLFIVVFGEMTNYTISSVKAVGSSNRDSFYSYYDDVTALIETVEKEDTGFYRMEIANGWTTNDPALYGYRGVSQFSSELNSKVTALMKSIGLAGDPASNRFGYKMSTPVINSMLNLKYIIGRNETVDDFTLGTPIYTSNGSTIYENKYPLSIGYVANYDIKESWATELTSAFDVQNQFAWCASGISSPVFNDLGTPFVTATGATAGDFVGNSVSVTSTDTAASASVELNYTATQTQPVYAYITAGSASSITATIDGGDTVSFEANRGSANALGTVYAGQHIKVNVTFETGKSGSVNCYMCGLDTEVWDRVYQNLNANALSVTKWSDTMIEGTVTTDKDGVFMTSIPYEKGWSVFIDGKKVKSYGIQDALLACDIKPGNHTVKMTYSPYGFNASLILSIGSLILLFVLDYLLKKYKKFKPESILVMVPDDKGLLEEYPVPEPAPGDEIFEIVEDDEVIINSDDGQRVENEELPVTEAETKPDGTESVGDILPEIKPEEKADDIIIDNDKTE